MKEFASCVHNDLPIHRGNTGFLLAMDGNISVWPHSAADKEETTESKLINLNKRKKICFSHSHNTYTNESYSPNTL